MLPSSPFAVRARADAIYGDYLERSYKEMKEEKKERAEEERAQKRVSARFAANQQGELPDFGTKTNPIQTDTWREEDTYEQEKTDKY